MNDSTPMLEEFVSLQRACAMIGFSYSSLQRYRRKGYKDVFLKTRKLGGKRLTTRKWLAEFVQQVNAAIEAESAADAVNSTAVIESLQEAEEAARRKRLIDDGVIKPCP